MISRVVRCQRGQATVEMAVSSIFLVIVLLLLLQVGLVARDQVLVTQAAREAARTAAVDSAPAAPAAAALRATEVSPSRLDIEVGPRPDRAGMVRVDAGYRSRIVFPGVGRIISEPYLTAWASMKVEGGR